MQIKRLNIDINFPSELIQQINELNYSKDYSSIWQTTSWNLILQDTNYIQKWFFLWTFENEKLVNFVIIEKRKISLNNYANFVIWWPNSNFWLELLEQELIKLAKEEKVVFTQIEDLVENDYKLFKKWVYKKFIEKCTAVIDLSKSTEDILAQMKQKGRYNIKLAEKHEVKVNKVEYNSMNLDLFYNLLVETKTRDNFFINSRDYFDKLLGYLYKNNIWGLYFATKDNELISAWIFCFYWKVAYYYYWASTTDNNKRKYMAAYLLQWSLIKEAKTNWYKIFDFLWINCPGCNSKKLAWVTDFKQKLTPEYRIWPDAHIFINNKFKFYLIVILRTIKWLF